MRRRFAISYRPHARRIPLRRSRREPCQLLAQRARCRRAFRRLWRAFRRGNAHATRARAGGSLRNGKARCAIQGRTWRSVTPLRRSPESALLRPAAHGPPPRAKNLSEARRPQSHWRPQDQQLPRPDSASAPHGKDSYHRGNRSRPARGRDSDGCRALRSAMCRLHGRR